MTYLDGTRAEQIDYGNSLSDTQILFQGGTFPIVNFPFPIKTEKKRYAAIWHFHYDISLLRLDHVVSDVEIVLKLKPNIEDQH